MLGTASSVTAASKLSAHDRPRAAATRYRSSSLRVIARYSSGVSGS
jgi:hypothetical protein